MMPRDGDGNGGGFAGRNWPWLLIVFGACVLWYYQGGQGGQGAQGGQGGNVLVGIVGFTGFGWLAWALLVKPRL